ncbi:hypothetical protein ACTFIR_007638 [Dictyostelium discoideum]
MQKSYIKLLVLGDSKTGKTTMMMTYSTGSFPTGYVPSHVDATSLDIEYNEQVCHVGFWDSSALAEFDNTRPSTYPNTNVIILCFSIDSPTSFENVSRKWIPEIRQYAPSIHTPIILLGTKCDLRQDENTINSLKESNQMPPISYKQGLALSKEIKATMYLECSSLCNQGVNEIFKQVVRCHLYCKDGVLNDPTTSSNTSKSIQNQLTVSNGRYISIISDYRECMVWTLSPFQSINSPEIWT